MKTKKEIESLLKSYETRRANINREFSSHKIVTVSSYSDYLEKDRMYAARIQTCKVILK